MTTHTRSPRPIPILVTTATVLFVLAVVVALPGSSLALDPRAAACGEVVIGTIKSQVALDRASDYRKVFPKMGYSPELEDSSPVFFVVYETPTEVLSMFGAPPPLNADGSMTEFRQTVTERTGVVCAITKYGRIVYTDVDTSP